MRKKILMIAAVLFGSAAFAFGQNVPNLPNDPATKVGKLENGMTYYIRHNDKPEGRAEFYLATNVGALQEAPDQDGLAHFLEHMCFNGTKNFPGKGILNWLESIGASFGGNVNASTGVEQTIYLLNNIPLVRPTVVDTCLLIMHDYSHFVTCDPKEIDSERGVILEEKRSRNTADWRVREASSKYIFGDTKYATTTVIGSEENLKTFKPESLTNFYHTWYRPDMQALVVVGDFDVDEVEAKIKKTFADIPAAENPKEKDIILIPENKEPIIGIITDKELTTTDIAAYWKSEPLPEEMNSTTIGLLTDLLKDIISSAMNERFNDLSNKSDSPFIAGGFGFGSLCETCEATVSQVTAKEGKAIESLEAMLTECRRMTLYGFSESEIERAKTEILSQYESAAKKADTRKNSEFVMGMVYNFFDNKPFMDPKTEYELLGQIMPQLTAQMVNETVSQMNLDENLVLIYTAPERDGNNVPTEDELMSVIKKVQNADIARAEGEDIPSELLNPAKIKSGKIKSSTEGRYGSTVLTLSNGVRVTLYPTDLQKDRITFSFTKDGGKNLIPVSDIDSFNDNIWSSYSGNSGVSSFSANTLTKMLAGKQLVVSPFIGNYSHGVSGSATVKDIESAMQLFYLFVTAPRFDENDFRVSLSQLETVLPNLVNTPNYKLQQALYSSVFDSPRRSVINSEILAKASLDVIEKYYRLLFKGANGAQMYITGDFKVDEIKPLLEKYVASLPKGKKAEESKYVGDLFVDGVKVNDFKTAMETPMVTVYQMYNVKTPYSVKDEAVYSALSYILNMVYTETLREEEGGTYGASANTQCIFEPISMKTMEVAFQTNVEQADKLRELAKSGFENIAKNGPDAEKFDKAVNNLKKEIPESRHNLSYWSNALSTSDKLGIDFSAEYEKAVNSLTLSDVQEAAKSLISSGNFIEIVMRPE